MRIISGTHKGRKIVAPKNLPVRPTTDFAKEGLFNILRNTYLFSTCTILDLFAGTGNISYEFASRGASQIISVDANFGCVKFIEKTAQEFQFSITTYKSSALSYLEKTNEKFDIIFADPPYQITVNELQELVHLVTQRKLLKDEGTFIIEHSKQNDLSIISGFISARKYGSSVFSFFQ